MPENKFLPLTWFKKYIVWEASLCGTRFQRFDGMILLCKLACGEHTLWEPKYEIAYLWVLEISQNIAFKRKYMTAYFKSFHR